MERVREPHLAEERVAHGLDERRPLGLPAEATQASIGPAVLVAADRFRLGVHRGDDVFVLDRVDEAGAVQGDRRARRDGVGAWRDAGTQAAVDAQLGDRVAARDRSALADQRIEAAAQDADLGRQLADTRSPFLVCRRQVVALARGRLVVIQSGVGRHQEFQPSRHRQVTVLQRGGRANGDDRGG